MRQNKAVKFLSFATLLTFAVSGAAFADEAQLMSMVRSMQEEMKEMRGTISVQNEEIRSLQSQRGSAEMPSSSGAPAASGLNQNDFNTALEKSLGKDYKWLKDLKFKGDYRLRYEAFNLNAAGNNDDRNRFRMRLRFGFEKKLSDEWKLGFRLATVDAAGSERTSTNASFDNAFLYKSIELDRAYATYTPLWGEQYGLEVTAGKFENPFEKGSSKIVWDGDVTPEGAYERASLGLVSTETFDITLPVTLGQFIVQEGNGPEGADAELFAVQGGLATSLRDISEKPIETNHLISYYHWDDYTSNTNFVAASGNPLNNATQLAAEEFRVFEVYNDVSFQVFGLPQSKIFVDWLINTQNRARTKLRGEDEDIAFAFGAKVGKINKKGDIEAGYEYRHIEANSVPGLFNDSDFGTSSGTNKRGHVISAGYGLTNFLQLNATAFFIDNLLGTDTEIDRYQLDLVYKF